MTAAQRYRKTEVRDLLDAIREALTVPVPETYRDPAEEQLRSERMAIVRGSINGVLDDGHDLDIAAKVCRDMTAKTPVTYAVHEPKADES